MNHVIYPLHLSLLAVIGGFCAKAVETVRLLLKVLSAHPHAPSLNMSGRSVHAKAMAIKVKIQ